jgi:uncharacterized membrane protein YgcG
VGLRAAFVFRLTLSLAALVAAQVALPYVARAAGATLALGTAVGFFDAVAFGSSAQLFATHHATASSAYFLGSSSASLVAIGASQLSGFAALSGGDGGGGALAAFYFSAAAVSTLALLAVLALLCSTAGERHLEQLDKELLEASPTSPRAVAARAPAETAARWGLGEPPLSGASAAAAAAAIDAGAIFRATRLLHASAGLLWLCTTLCDSLISFTPGARDTRAAADAEFRLRLLYASLGGELAGKLALIAVMAAGAAAALGAAARAAVRDASPRDDAGEALLSLTSRGGGTDSDGDESAGEGSSDGGGGGGRSGGSDGGGGGGGSDGGSDGGSGGRRARRRARRRRGACCDAQVAIFAACAARAALLAVPLVLYVFQPTLRGAPARGGTLLRGWFYSDGAVMAAQAAFDLSGAFLSSLVYATAPLYLASSTAQAKSSALLSVTLIAGSMVGLAGALGASAHLGGGGAGDL